MSFDENFDNIDHDKPVDKPVATKKRKRRNVEIYHAMKLCPLKKRQEKQMSSILFQVSDEIWLMIFSWLVPSNSNKIVPYYNLFNCCLVCKLWAQIASDKTLWFSLIHNNGNSGLWNDLTCNSNQSLWGPRQTMISPPSLYAQVTLRGFTEKDATVELLAKWFRKKRWRLLFQTLSPLLTLNNFDFDDDGQKRWNNSCFRDVMKSRMMKYGDVATHNDSVYEFRFNHYWGDNECGILQFFGDCFWVGKKENRGREPSHIVFHADRKRGPYLEIRTWMQGGLNCYSSTEIKPIHIWFGILCMQQLWKGHNLASYRERVAPIWRKAMNMEPKIAMF